MGALTLAHPQAGAPRLGEARRLVVKVGSALVVADGAPRGSFLAALAGDLARFAAAGCEILVVTSGAVGLGRARLGLRGGPLRLEEKQAAASLGQTELMAAWGAAFAPRPTAQVLLTPDDTEDRRRHLNGRATLETLLRLGAVPVINENDAVATAELRFGDNDRLAARVAQMVSADTLVLLSDIDGLYTADPRLDPGARHVPVVRDLTADVLSMAGPPPRGNSSGGMVTKLAAARIALAAGCRMAIARGLPEGASAGPLAALESGAARATWFLPQAEPRTARKRWIAGHVATLGTLTVDAGAVAALAVGRSLLPAGVTRVAGSFGRGDPVMVVGPGGRALGRGLAAYDAEDARAIAGRKSGEIEAILGWKGRDALIHRDDYVPD